MHHIQAGDAIIAREVRIADVPEPLIRTWFELTVVPETAARRYRILEAAIKQGQAIAEQCGVDLWYTEDHETYIPIMAPQHRIPA